MDGAWLTSLGEGFGFGFGLGFTDSATSSISDFVGCVVGANVGLGQNTSEPLGLDIAHDILKMYNLVLT